MKNKKTSNTYNKKASPFTEIFRKLAGNETQQAIADKVGITRQNVGKWLSGETMPDINTLGKIADAYGVSIDYLLGRTTCRNGVQTPYLGVWNKTKCKQIGFNEDGTISELEVWKCSSCAYRMSGIGKPTFNFCPNCGAKMDEEENNDKARN